jgi:intracellular sulfur oxidation DsrE/DsrF family protein
MPEPLRMSRIVGQTAALLSMVMGSQTAPLAAEFVQTPYQEEQKVVFDFYLDDPKKMGSALYWIRAYINPLSDPPYGYAPDFMSVKVIIHGTEIVTLAKKNYERYEESVERMRYYAALGVDFMVCGLAAEDYGYTYDDFYDFVTVVPSAITELGHWQQQGHALIVPQVLSRTLSIEEIR